MNQATFGSGCFWGAEAFFRDINGVIDTRVGYCCGSDGTTPAGRIEVVQIDFDPALVTFSQLLEFFWISHDPTSQDKQGNETGEAVRSAIFFHTAEQENLARLKKQQFSQKSDKPSVTQIIAFSEFELADEKHQQYVQKNGQHACFVATRGL